MRRVLLMVMSLLITYANAKQVFEANNGDTISATISSHDLTRIEIEGQKIIKDFSTANLSKKITKPLGQVYLIPNTMTTFNLYLVSDIGNTYNLKLTPSKRATGDSIIIKPLVDPVAKMHTSLSMSPSNYVKAMNYLVEIMYLNRDDDNQYDVSTPNQPISTYVGLKSVLYKVYRSNGLLGYVILIKNISKDKIILTEAEFYSPHTLGIAMNNPTLKPNEFTRIFIVKDGE